MWRNRWLNGYCVNQCMDRYHGFDGWIIYDILFILNSLGILLLQLNWNVLLDHIQEHMKASHLLLYKPFSLLMESIINQHQVMLDLDIIGTLLLRYKTLKIIIIMLIYIKTDVIGYNCHVTILRFRL